MKSPVLFILFKREDTTRRVFERIREAQPPRLYIAADGPRKDRPDEVEKCMETRKVVEKIDWPCEVKRLYRDENLGCGKGVSSAITWFFEHEEQGIIIEDDILPHLDFFLYCDEMLDLYKYDTKIQLITGRNSFFKGFMSPSTYYMSNLFHIWGWASWRRVWNTYEFDSKKMSYEHFFCELSKRELPIKTVLYWKDIFVSMQSNPIDTWDYQLYFNQILYGRYSIVPFINMTENLGFNSIEATHTKSFNYSQANHKAHSPFPIIHPTKLAENIDADVMFAKNSGFFKASFLDRVKGKVLRALDIIRYNLILSFF